ncbi:hypothetical protein BKA70DRAFT_1395315, partial [Coprinopsis sp. MPI-PUGE-AT-0042]
MASSTLTMDQFPAELLAEIFMLNRYESSFLETMAWTAVTQVCRRWRDIALAYPTLWSDITIEAPYTPWIPVMLERSAAVAIDLKIREGNQPLIAQAFAHPSGLRTLELSSKYFSLLEDKSEDQIISVPTDPAAALEEIVLERSQWLTLGLPRTLPFNFLAGVAPRLRKLVLRGLQLDSWNSPLLGCTMTNLKLDFMGLVVPREGLVLEALDRMVNLETLWLRVPLPGCERPASCHRKVKLPKLQELGTLDVPMEQLAWLLQHISIPVSATLDVHCTLQGNARRPTIHSFTSALRTSWLNDPLETKLLPPSFHHLIIKFECFRNGKPMALLGWFKCGPRGNRSFPQLSLRIEEGGTKESLSTILDAFPLERIMNLDLFADLRPHEITPLARLPALQSVDCHSARSFVEYLASAPMTPTVTPFPSLKYLLLNGQDFTGEYLELKDTVSVKRLIQCLSRRKEGGREVLVFGLVSCKNLFSNDVRKIAEICDKVLWDGEERKISRH